MLLFLDPGSGMEKNQDPGSWINIPDPQHWFHDVFGTVAHPRIRIGNADPDPGARKLTKINK
jgi:hypothetical protein